MPQRDIFHRRGHRATDHTGKSRQIFGQDRVAFVRHGRTAFLTWREIFLRLQHFGALQMTNLYGEPFYGRCNNAQNCKKHGMPVTWDNLC